MTNFAEPQPLAVQPYPATLNYHTPTAKPSVRVAGAAAVLLAGLGLIGLGGCFLIGVMLMVTGGFNTPAKAPTLTPAQYVLLVLLYVLAFASFAGAAVIIVVGLRWMYAVLFRSPGSP